jgi:lipoprotein-anchoring transpeptidase ErfK/SrfK
MKRLKWWAWTAIAFVILAAAGAGAFVWTEHAQAVSAGQMSPASDSVLATSSVTVACPLGNYKPGRGTITLAVDGQEIPAAALSLSRQGMQADLDLDDGTHTVVMDYSSSNPFSPHYTRSLTLTVDTTSPSLHVVSPAPATFLVATPAQVEVQSDEPVAGATLTIDGVSTPATVAGDTVTADVPIDSGTYNLSLTVTDQAGNRATTTWQAQADVDDPVFDVADGWPGDTWKKNNASLVFAAEDTFPAYLTVSAKLDGQSVPLSEAKAQIEAGSGDGSATSPTSGTGSTATTAPTPGSGPVSGVGSLVGARSYSLAADKLPEGRHTLEVTVSDVGGHTTTWTRSFLVDSTESFGKAVLGPGAKGKDVKALQQVLAAKGLYKGKVTSVLDDATEEAVAAYEKAHGLTATPLVDQSTAKALLGFIRVDRAKRKLYLYQDGKLVKTYSVAVGQPTYPTPVGTFAIISKEVNPTWYPPNSPWAKGAKPIGPGPNCPLQARAMWLSAPAVGIHGTNAPSSIGHAASHGCIRMRVADVIDLYKRVFVGTPVQIVD